MTVRSFSCAGDVHGINAPQLPAFSSSEDTDRMEEDSDAACDSNAVKSEVASEDEPVEVEVVSQDCGNFFSTLISSYLL